jgi:hypothetical protein
MPQEFYKRLLAYYRNVAKVLRGEAEAASVFPNPTDIGQSREIIYARFLQQHAPSKCNVFLGGFLFHDDGTESKQLDVIVTTDTAPRFNFHNPDGSGKSFSPVEGTLGVASIKSTLDKKELHDALHGLASIPAMQPLEGRVLLAMNTPDYDEWPYKIIYASNGIDGKTILRYIHEFYLEHPEIPITRKPNLIHVAGQYAVIRVMKGMMTKNVLYSGPDEIPELGTFHLLTHDSDVQAIVWTLNDLQQKASASTGILFNYDRIIINLFETT